MPVWHSKLQDLVNSGDLQIVGLIQEQHAERCRLFAQWHRIEWPILYDPMNQLGVKAVPIFVALDADGIVRNTNATPEWVRETLMTEHAIPSPSTRQIPATRPVTEELLNADTISPNFTNEERLALSDAEILWSQPSDWNNAIAGYQAIDSSERNAAVSFRLGIAYRGRWDSGHRQPKDFANSVAAWENALELDPNHYIYRRRLQQYGPRLNKPYPFYDWIDDAQAAIRARGEIPIPITVPLTGSELAAPSENFESETTARNPDPDKKIKFDEQSLIAIRCATVPQQPKLNEPFRLHISLSPTHTTHWNNETPPAVIWLEIPDGWLAEHQLLELPQATEPESREERVVDLELNVPASPTGTEMINSFALYYVCNEQGGQCLYLRQAFQVELRVNP